MLGILAIPVLAAAVALLASFIAAQFIGEKDEEIAERREAAQHIATTLSTMGLVEVPKFLVKYSVGNYKEMAKELIKLFNLFKSGEDAVIKEFNKVADNVIAARLKTEAGRSLLQAQLTLATAPAVDAAPAAPTPIGFA